MSITAAAPERRTAKAKATAFLQAALAGDPVPATEVGRMAREHGLTAKVVRAAREALGIRIARHGFGPGSKSLWSLPRAHTDAQPILSEVGENRRPTTNYEIIVIGPANYEIIRPADNPCDYCDTRDGTVYLVRNPFDGGLIEPLHEPCARHWFDWLGKMKKEARERMLDRARERMLQRLKGKI
jgi:hypothetical protein